MRATLQAVFAYWHRSADTEPLPKWRQGLEMGLLFLFRQIGPAYYVQADWGRREVAFREKWRHMNRREYRRFVARMNPPLYRKQAQHKQLEKALLTLMALPTAPFIGLLHPQRGRSASGQPLRKLSELQQLLRPLAGRTVVAKQVEGFGGLGVRLYDVATEDQDVVMVFRETGERFALSCWPEWQSDDAVLLEHAVQQHPTLAALNASSLNTVRMWVFLDENGAQILAANLRMGRAGRCVDNTSSGGVVCRVDVQSGRTSVAMDPHANGVRLLRHPDSGAELLGIQLPFWEQACRLAAQALAAFPQQRFSGLDMAFTPEGPLLIELNPLPDYVACAWMELPLRAVERCLRSGSAWPGAKRLPRRDVCP